MEGSNSFELNSRENPGNGEKTLIPEHPVTTYGEESQHHSSTTQPTADVYQDIPRETIEQPVHQTPQETTHRMKLFMEFVSKVDAENVEARILLNEFSSLIKDDRFADLPILVICFTGPKRKGKSFLVELCISYLRYLENPDRSRPWMETNPPLTSGNWNPYKYSVTQGLLMCDKIFVIPTTEGNEVGVLVLDSQGLRDDSESQYKSKDTLIGLCGLELSKFQIINVQKDFEASDVEHFENCFIYAEKEKDDQPTFSETLLILRRDVPLREEWGGPHPVSPQGRGVGKRTAEVIRQFEDCKEFVIPRPSTKIESADATQNFTLQDFIEESSSDYFANAEKLFQFLFNELPQDQRYLRSQQELLSCAEKLYQVVKHEHGQMVFESPKEIAEKRRFENFNSLLRDEVLPQVQSYICPEDYVRSEKSQAMLEADIEACCRQTHLLTKNIFEKYHDKQAPSEHLQKSWLEIDKSVMRCYSEMVKTKCSDFKRILQWKKMEELGKELSQEKDKNWWKTLGSELLATALIGVGSARVLSAGRFAWNKLLSKGGETAIITTSKQAWEFVANQIWREGRKELGAPSSPNDLKDIIMKHLELIQRLVPIAKANKVITDSVEKEVESLVEKSQAAGFEQYVVNACFLLIHRVFSSRKSQKDAPDPPNEEQSCQSHSSKIKDIGNKESKEFVRFILSVLEQN